MCLFFFLLDLVLLEQHSNADSHNKSQIHQNICEEVPRECGNGILRSGIEAEELDDSDMHQSDYENLKLKLEKLTYPPALYKSLRKMVHESDSFSPPSPEPQTPTEVLFQRDKSILQDTSTRKRYHTSPHDKHKVCLLLWILFFHRQRKSMGTVIC